MKNFTRTCIFTAAVLGISMGVNAQQESSAFVATNAEVIIPIQVVGVTALSFGDIVGTSAGGTVTMGSDGTRTASINDLVMAAQPGTVSAAEFTVTGQAEYAYSIALPSAAFTVENGDTTAATMSVDTFESNSSGTIGGGSETVNVGAVLTVAANQAQGTYTSAEGLTVTVQYN